MLTDGTRDVCSPLLPLDLIQQEAAGEPPAPKRARHHDRTYTVPGSPGADTTAPSVDRPAAIRTT